MTRYRHPLQTDWFEGLFAMLFVVLGITVVLLWIAGIYVAIHFIGKYW